MPSESFHYGGILIDKQGMLIEMSGYKGPAEGVNVLQVAQTRSPDKRNFGQMRHHREEEKTVMAAIQPVH